MEIIKIHYKASKPVVSYGEIKNEAEKLKRFVVRGALKGYYNKAFAIAHSEVNETPMAFFVVSPEVVGERMFEKQVIINPEILRSASHKEISPGVSVPNAIEYQEPCLSFPYRTPKTIKRYDLIWVRYQVRGLFGLRTKERTLSGIASQIFQHECEHIQGRNMYFKSEEPVEWWNLIGSEKSKGGTSLDDPEKLGLRKSAEKAVGDRDDEQTNNRGLR